MAEDSPSVMYRGRRHKIAKYGTPHPTTEIRLHYLSSVYLSIKSSQVINSHNAFCICAKSKQQKSKIKACAILLFLSLLWLSPAGLIVCKYFSHGRNPTFRSPLSLSTCARGAIAILKRVTLRVASCHTPRSSMSPAGQQFVIQSSHMKIKFHVCGLNWLSTSGRRFRKVSIWPGTSTCRNRRAC